MTRHTRKFTLSNTLTKEQIDSIVSAHGAGIRTALEDGGVSARASGREPQRPAIYPSNGRVQGDEPTSIGDASVTSDAYRG
jgi:hypothetical protein